jgi:hypothetical protein
VIHPKKGKLLFSCGANLGIYDDNLKKIAQDRFLTITIAKYGFYLAVITI